MGRITMFCADGCPHSRRVEAAFARRGIPLVQISATQHPDKRADMIALSQGRRSTPQVFFNTRHVGGVDETLAVLHEWDGTDHCETVQDNKKKKINKSKKEEQQEKRVVYQSAYQRFQQEIEQQFDPSNPRFQIPQHSPETVVDLGPPRGTEEYSIVLPTSTRTTKEDGPQQQTPNNKNKKMTVLEMTNCSRTYCPYKTLPRDGLCIAIFLRGNKRRELCKHTLTFH